MCLWSLRGRRESLVSIHPPARDYRTCFNGMAIHPWAYDEVDKKGAAWADPGGRTAETGRIARGALQKASRTLARRRWRGDASRIEVSERACPLITGAEADASMLLQTAQHGNLRRATPSARRS